MTTAQTQPKLQTTDQENQLRQVIVDYQTYVNAADAQGYSSLFTEDIVWMPPNAPDRMGVAEVFNAQSTTFSKMQLSVELTPTEVRTLNEEWGLVVCSIRGTATPRTEGAVIEIRFRALFLMARQPDGGWCIARQMWNNKPQ